jgi:hypothetical protein
VQRTLSDRTPFTAAARLPPDLLQESVSDIDIPALQNGGVEFGGSRESFEEEYPEYRDFDSTTTPSDASTVIFRELLSRCSNTLPVPGEECVVGGSYDTSPIASRHTVATAGEEGRDSSPRVQRYSVDTSRSDSKTTPLGIEDSEISSPVSDSKDADSNSNVEENRGADNSAPSETSDDSVTLDTQEHEPVSNSVGNNLSSSSTLSSSEAHFPDSTEQVTDIYAPRLNHTPSPVELEGATNSEDNTFCGDDIDIGESLENSKKMESYMHYQQSGGPIVDSEPIGMNGVRTHGYPSNNDSKTGLYSGTDTSAAAGTTSSVDVPHHSLTLALSDPDSPSSYQVS